MNKKQILQESLRKEFDYINRDDLSEFMNLVNDLNKIYNFDKKWMHEIVIDFNFFISIYSES